MRLLYIFLVHFSTIFYANKNCEKGNVFIKELEACFLFVDDAAAYEAAESQCNASSGHLISIHNAFENNLMAQYADQDMRSTRVLLGLQKSPSGVWSWSDNTTANYFKWANGEPGSKSCAYLDILDRSWYGQDCDTITPFVCKIPVIPPCKPGWVYWNVTKMCYYHGKNSSFQQALGFCGYNSGSVTSVHSDQENDFIKNLVWVPECIQMGRWFSGLTMLGGTWDQMNAFPSSCNGCGDGVWTMYGFDRINEKLPDFVCKAPSYV